MLIQPKKNSRNMCTNLVDIHPFIIPAPCSLCPPYKEYHSIVCLEMHFLSEVCYKTIFICLLSTLQWCLHRESWLYITSVLSCTNIVSFSQCLEHFITLCGFTVAFYWLTIGKDRCRSAGNLNLTLTTFLLLV